LTENQSIVRNLLQSIIHYGIEFDVIGLLIIATGFSLFLLAFNLYSYQPGEQHSLMIICFIVVGFCLIVCFTLWEKYLAPVKFIPWELIQNWTVFFTFSMVVSLYFAWYFWDNYFCSLLQVMFDQTVAHATYIANIYTIGPCFWCLVFGPLLRKYGRLKWWTICFGVSLTVLGVGLMIKFRQLNLNIGYIVMCQLFVAFGGGTLMICEQMTVIAVSTQRNIPAILTIEGVVASIGSVFRSTVAVTMWTRIFHVKLKEFLPPSAPGELTSIYGSLSTQLSYAKWTGTRDAIDHAYGETQKLMLITATCLYLTTCDSCLFWKDLNLKKMKQLVDGVHFLVKGAHIPLNL
jgi:hypothetical protein